MNLLVTQGDISSIWQVDQDGRASRMTFPKYGERDLCPSVDFLRSMNLPLEIVEQILLHIFRHYLYTYNFDLCADLFWISRSFTKMIYRLIYKGGQSLNFYHQYTRLYKTFVIMDNIYDEYISKEGHEPFHCLKLTSARPANSRHQPWDFVHLPEVVRIMGNVVDLTETQLQVRYGKCYGETVWISGYENNGVFCANTLKTPVINLMMVDIFDSLILDEESVTRNYLCFFRLLKRVFGTKTALFVMVKDVDNRQNPFITHSDIFLEL